jgi:hypothetical protein
MVFHGQSPWLQNILRRQRLQAKDCLSGEGHPHCELDKAQVSTGGVEPDSFFGREKK